MAKNKERQHYIQKASLTPWADDNKNIFLYLKKERKIIVSSPVNIGVERNFYALPDLSKTEFLVAKGLTDFAGISDNLISRLYSFSVFKQSAQDAKERRIWQKVQNTFIEELYGVVESKFPRERLLANDLSFWRKDKKMTLDCVAYIVRQQFRTKRTQDTIVMLQKENSYWDDNYIDWEKVYKYYNFILPINVIENIMNSIHLFNLEVVTVENENALLVGDQPVINLETWEPQGSNPLSRISLYYPISPVQALCIYHNDSKIQFHGKLPQEDVDKLNNKQIERSLYQVYSNSEKLLHKYFK
ncbi:MAG: DUF4238 domain-containing protein [Sphaerochaeta sp.]|uniref:DUF4238 domain-containing protein n=1 Tax=Sphaerochaeta sp. TaxID=1972642 RepID=UPI003D136FC0